MGARLLLAGLLLLGAGGAANLRAAWVTRGSPLNLPTPALRLGVDASYPPLAVAEADGSLRGLEVDLARELARRLDVRLELKNTDVGGGLDALAGNQFDGLLAGLSRSPDLEDRAAFSRPYLDDGPRLLAVGAPPGSLGGLRVAVELGSPGDEAVRRHLRQGETFVVDRLIDPASVVAELTAGTADLAVLDATTAYRAAGRDVRLRVSAAPLESRPLSLALRRPNRALLFAVDQALEQMEADGFLAALAERWLET